MSTLSPKRAEELLALAANPNPASRSVLFKDLSGTMLTARTTLSQAEAALMTSILQKLVSNIAEDVRMDLASSLAANNDDVPELVHLIINDKIDIAKILLNSNAFIPDAELIEVIQHKSSAHQLTIALRRNISMEVSDALVETGNSEVISALLNNKTATIREATRDYLIDQAKSVDLYQRPLVRRDDLSAKQMIKLYGCIADTLKQELITRYCETYPELVEKLKAAPVKPQKKAAAQPEPKSAITNAERVALTLQKDGQLTRELLLKVLQSGEYALFEAFYAQLAQLPLEKMRHILLSDQSDLLAISAKAIRLTGVQFLEMNSLLQQRQSNKKRLSSDEQYRMLRYFESLNNHSAVSTLLHWKNKDGADS